MNDHRNRWHKTWCAVVFVSALVSVPLGTWAICATAPYFPDYLTQIERDLQRWTP